MTKRKKVKLFRYVSYRKIRMARYFSFSRRARWCQRHFASSWSLDSLTAFHFGFQWINTLFHSSEAILYVSPVQGLQNCIWKLRLISFYYAERVINVRQFARKTRLIGSFQLFLDFFKSTQDLTEFRCIRRSFHWHFPLQGSIKAIAKWKCCAKHVSSASIL